MNPTTFLTELKRRNVYRAAVAYGVVAWFLTQLTTQVFPFFEIPNSAVRFMVIALAIGFPIAMLIAWLYEFTPEGIARTEISIRYRRDRFSAPLDGSSTSSLSGYCCGYCNADCGATPVLQADWRVDFSESIAVLPFENLSEDKANAYFADGIQDEILTRLSKIADPEGDLAHLHAALQKRA